MKALLLFGLLAYLCVGMLFGLYTYSYDLRTFICEDATSPNGEMTVGYAGWGATSFQNPDPDHCRRRGAEWRAVAAIPAFTLSWPVLLVPRIAGELNEPEGI